MAVFVDFEDLQVLSITGGMATPTYWRQSFDLMRTGPSLNVPQPLRRGEVCFSLRVRRLVFLQNKVLAYAQTSMKYFVQWCIFHCYDATAAAYHSPLGPGSTVPNAGATPKLGDPSAFHSMTFALEYLLLPQSPAELGEL